MLSLNKLETEILLDLFGMEYEQGAEPEEKNYFEEGADWQEHCKQVAFSVIKLKKTRVY